MAVTAARVSGIRADECLLLPPGAVPKTPSGKVQRFRARQLLAEGGREAVARVSF
jgi:acyl-CoA synthetase (AMP-forming)/AMP-acid ligase II